MSVTGRAVKAVVCACALALALPASAVAQNRRWEIEPKADARLQFGKMSVIGGLTNQDGVRFVINNLEITQPIEIVLAAEDAAKPLKLLVYKDAPEHALLDRDTDAGGSAVAKFRTEESVQMMVKGPAGAKYQLMAWVGPRVERETPTLFTPLDANGSPLVAGTVIPPGNTVPAGGGASSPATGASQVPTTGVAVAIPTYVTVLLGLILIAIIVLIIVVMRGRGKPAAVIILLGVFFGAQPGSTRAQAPPAMDLAPGTVKGPDVWKAVNERINQLREQLDTLEKMGVKSDVEAIKIAHPDDKPSEGGEKPGSLLNGMGKTAGQFVTNTKLILAFLEEFGLIDPREAAVQPNYNPPGQPIIPSRCSGTGQCGACFLEANAKLDKARKLLEDMYVIYKQTELKTGRIHELANAAAGLSPYAQLAWTAIKNNPNEGMNIAQKHFYDVYDDNLGKLLTMANEGLIGVGACERDNFKDYDWYARYGMIYYNFLQARYTRK